ncbi:hypothetical protein KU43P_21130 [Pseudomonas sp. KU43P]|nr:hypothetical protein KU43P_21130 [Pseudomonas sp. KU43P]
MPISCLAAARSGLADIAVDSAWGKLMPWAKAAGAINPQMAAHKAATFQAAHFEKTLR